MPDRPRLVVHIGQHKTGTSALQKYLDTQRTRLHRVGVWYPRAGLVGRQHAVLPASVIPHRTSVAQHWLKDPIVAAAELVADLDPASLNVVSSEVWWELLAADPAVFDWALSLVSDHAEVTCFYVVREPVEKMWSSAKHLGRLGTAMDVSRLCASQLAADEAALEHLTASQPDAIVAAYDPDDAVGAALQALTPLAPRLPGRTPFHRRLTLSRFLRRERAQDEVERVNADPGHDRLPALTLSTSQALWDHQVVPSRTPALATFHQGIAASSGTFPELLELPPEAVFRERVLARKSGPLPGLLTPTETAALRRFWERPAIGERCAQAGLAEYHAQAVAAVRDAAGRPGPDAAESRPGPATDVDSAP